MSTIFKVDYFKLHLFLYLKLVSPIEYQLNLLQAILKMQLAIVPADWLMKNKIGVMASRPDKGGLRISDSYNIETQANMLLINKRFIDC